MDSEGREHLPGLQQGSPLFTPSQLGVLAGGGGGEGSSPPTEGPKVRPPSHL